MLIIFLSIFFSEYPKFLFWSLFYFVFMSMIQKNAISTVCFGDDICLSNKSLDSLQTLGNYELNIVYVLIRWIDFSKLHIFHKLKNFVVSRKIIA